VNASLPILYFNTELVKKAGGDPANMPNTWDGIVALAGKIAATSPGTAGMAYDVHVWPDTWLFQATLDQSGGRMLDDSGRVAFDNANGRKALAITGDSSPTARCPCSTSKRRASNSSRARPACSSIRRRACDSSAMPVGSRFTIGTTGLSPSTTRRRAASRPAAARSS
jgi:hypothetical protein